MTAGVALVGAGAIAFAPLPVLSTEVVVAAPSAPEVFAPRVVTTEVLPAGLISSLQLLANGAGAAVTESVDAFQNDVPAIFDQVVAQWPDITLTPWNHSLVAAALLAPVAPLLVGPFNDAAAEVLAQVFPGIGDEIRQGLPAAIEYAFARLVGPFLSAIGATGAVHQDYYFAGMAGDRVGQNLALLLSPIKVIDGFLNGGYGDLGPLLSGDVGGPRIAAPGLLTPWGQWPVDRNVIEQDDELSQTFAEPGATEELTPAAAKTAAAAVDVVSSEEVSDPAEAVETAVEAEVDEATVAPVTSLPTEPASSDADTETEETKPSRLSIRQGIKDLQDGVRKLTGAGRPESTEADDAPKPGKADKPEKADKSESAEKSDSDAAGTE
ncbi:MAG: hypothetical protein ABWY45_10965 [Mycobacterium sp.]